MLSKRSLSIPRHSAQLAAWCGLLCLTGWLNAAETNRVSSEVTIPKSVFVADGGTGKDPFFPNSTRLRKIVPDETTKGTAVQEDFSRLLKLTGIAGGARPIATVNNLTFAVGEEQEVKVDGRKIRIRVLEIRAKSVVVKVEKQPAPVELKLRDVELKFTE